jgi:hypothetical protein
MVKMFGINISGCSGRIRFETREANIGKLTERRMETYTRRRLVENALYEFERSSLDSLHLNL